MKLQLIYCILAVTAALLTTASNGFAYGSYGTAVNNLCAPAAPYTGDCALCHASSRAAPTPAKEAYVAGGTTLTDYFCPATTPTCTDNDGDTFAIEGGSCGQVDCNDNNGGINPVAFDIPNNGIDENCDGADSLDPNLIDNDGDGFMPTNGDCNDTDNTIYPGAPEICGDGIDNDCDSLTDEDCNPACPDSDNDGYREASCGGSDCNDYDDLINPGAAEICDTIDNNCDARIDESSACKSEFWTLMLPVIRNAANIGKARAAPANDTPPPVTVGAGPIITATSRGGGTIDPSGSVAVPSGTNALFTMTPLAGYKLVDLLVDGTSISVRARYLFLKVTGNHTIEAFFLPAIEAAAGPGGYIWPNGSRSVDEVERLTGMTYVFTPMVGYHIADVLVNEVSVGAVPSYTFPGGITEPQTIRVTFALD